jgi:N,N'-diacetyllegionaminate synthase
MRNLVKIGEKKLENYGCPFIVAEVGINHNGDIGKAFEMIDVAKSCKVDAVKFQTFKAKEFIADKDQKFTYQSQGQEVTESMLDMFSRYEFKDDDWYKIKKYCDEAGIMFLSTPQNSSDLDVLLTIGVDAIKVGSDDFTNLPLLSQYAKTGLPLIVSTGMANMAEIYEALDVIGTFNGYPTVLLQCTSSYPTPLCEVNLNKMKTLQGAFPGVVLGFSDHTQGTLASSLAVAMGACFFEKHFTLSNDLPGPDHWFSENPVGLKKWCNSIRSSYELMGSPILKPTESEVEMRKIARRSIVANNDISAGERLSRKNLTLRRPGTGLEPKFLEKIINRISTKEIKKNSLITLEDFV